MHPTLPTLLILISMLLTTLVNADNATSTSPDPATTSATCKPGVSIGQILISQPNMSSFVFVGNPLVVQWTYTVLVKNKPNTVDIKIYSVSDTKNIITLVSGLDVSNGAKAWLWNVGQIAAGSYKAHIVPDGKETLNKKQNELPCFVNGDAMPGTSGAFGISQLQPLATFPDRFPPNKLGTGVVIESASFLVVFLIATVVLATLAVTIVSDLIKLNIYRQQSFDQQQDETLDPLLVIQQNRGDHLDVSSLPIVLLPASEILVIWDIICLQLLHIPSPWLKTFGCTIFPRVFENVLIAPKSLVETLPATPQDNPDTRVAPPHSPSNTLTSKTFDSGSSSSDLVSITQTGSVQTILHTLMATTTIINIDSTVSKEPKGTTATTSTASLYHDIPTPVSEAADELLIKENHVHKNHEDTCIFCGIADNPNEKSRKVYEDDKVSEN
ncbi:UNVERIFIED_CONTAM: hypothetical protein HDU68_008407 [Siphonaria sp. JEL0065]|nr:hypothetical protein HDU68_008407 [Siphonaria sp. JEL0065]